MNEKKIIFECPLSFSLMNDNQQVLAKGSAHAQIDKEHLTILSDAGDARVFPLRELVQIEDQEYHLFLPFTFNQQLNLFNLGYKFEDFTKTLSKCHHEIIMQDMLVKENIRKKDITAEYARFNEKGEKIRQGKCELRIFETTLAVLPEKGDIIRLPLGNIRDLQPEDYGLSVNMDFGEKVVLSQMGTQLDPFKKILSDTLSKLSSKTQTFLQGLLPETDAPTIYKVSHLLKEGRIAARKDIEVISAPVWTGIEKKIALSPLGDEYDFLKPLGRQDKIGVGFKRGLLAGDESDYFWFLIPIYGTQPGEPGNAVVLEAGLIRLPKEGEEGETGEEGEVEESVEDEVEVAEGQENETAEDLLKQEGKATYFFRIVSREAYAALKDKTELDRKYDEFILSFNRCMQEVNFRREPIYLPEKRLDEPRYVKYRYALKRLPELRKLRELFIGRVFHQSQEQWRKDTLALLAFNTQSRNDLEKWQKGEKGE